MDLHQKSTFGAIEGRDPAAMKAHRAFGDGQAQTHTAGLPAAIIVQPIKRLEQLLQASGGTPEPQSLTRTTASAPLDSLLLQVNLNRCAFAGVANGIANHVFNGAVQREHLRARPSSPPEFHCVRGSAAPGLRIRHLR